MDLREKAHSHKVLEEIYPKLMRELRKIGLASSKGSGRVSALLSTLYSAVSEHLETKTPADLSVDHCSNTVFYNPNATSVSTIKHDWWNQAKKEGGAALYRSILAAGPAHIYCPPYDARHDPRKNCHKGYLCTPCVHNLGSYTPIEQLAQVYFATVADTGRGTPSASEIFHELVYIFSSSNDVQAEGVDSASISFVRYEASGSSNYKGNRHDVIRMLRFAYIVSWIVYLSNPVGFEHCYPTRAIINIFISQTNFFPAMPGGLDLSATEKHWYLTKLGYRVAEALGGEHAGFFLDNHRLWPTADSLTQYPVCQQRVDVVSKQLETKYFLFGEPVSPEASHEDDPAVTAVAFDPYMLAQMRMDSSKLNKQTFADLLPMIRMVLPLGLVNIEEAHNERKYYGFTKKEAIKAIVNNRERFTERNGLEPYIERLAKVNWDDDEA